MNVIASATKGTTEVQVIAHTTTILGPYSVEIRRNGHYSSSHAGIKTLDRAMEVFHEYISMYDMEQTP